MIKIWDKKTDINGVKAKDFIDSHDLFNIEDEIILIINDETKRVEQVQRVDILREILGLDKKKKATEVGKLFLESLSK